MYLRVAQLEIILPQAYSPCPPTPSASARDILMVPTTGWSSSSSTPLTPHSNSHEVARLAGPHHSRRGRDTSVCGSSICRHVVHAHHVVRLHHLRGRADRAPHGTILAHHAAARIRLSGGALRPLVA